MFSVVVVAKQRIRNYFHNSREIPTHSAREATVPWRQTSTGTFDLRAALNYQTNMGIQPESTQPNRRGQNMNSTNQCPSRLVIV